ncbi:uncharacterized protein LOC120276100 [Dioscorea cayenensis subsp. rotundata]|uniref:Uncharacterized protein LOC120276100 n=1 Tax=Dioscorea cayennensis subsp. rotundata TaxID=55577 RepID=A0AB40CJ32_DIOCR|nr:uncharacterized protein LOC120276100 [Dioscorea cayenensis subsp. rotundata]
MDQVHELQILVSKLKDLNIEVSEALKVGAAIAKLPPSWNDYRKKLLHSSESFSLEQLHKHLIIEEETRIRDGKRFGKESDSNVNFIYVNKSNRFGKKRKLWMSIQTRIILVPKKEQDMFFIARRKGIFKKECSVLEENEEGSCCCSGSNNKVSIVEEQVKDLVAMVSDLQISMITEVNMAAFSNTNGRWYDSEQPFTFVMIRISSRTTRLSRWT